MATPLDVLTRDLARAIEAQDADGARNVRRSIVAGHPDAPAAHDAAYRLGLDALVTERRLDLAAEHFRAATKARDPQLQQAARTSLGLALARLGKPQQATFELRKAASAKPATLANVQALSFIESLAREQKNGAEADRVRAEILKTLDAMRRAGASEDAAMAELLLGAEAKSEGKRDVARKHLAAALAGGHLPPDARARAERLLADVS
jgi:tetratricopeptide (TPR) repeat protein